MRASRGKSGEEALTDRSNARTAFVVIDHDLHVDGTTLTSLYSKKGEEIGRTIMVGTRQDGARVIRLTAPPAGFVAYA